jgi:hypothetical protein
MNWDSWPHQCTGEMGGPDVGETHLPGSQPKVPSSGCLALSGAPAAHWQGQEVFPHHWAICLGTGLICFPAKSSCPLLGRGLGWS